MWTPAKHQDVSTDRERGKRGKGEQLCRELELYIDHVLCFQFNICFKFLKSEVEIPDIVQRQEMPGAVEITWTEKSELSKGYAIC